MTEISEERLQEMKREIEKVTPTSLAANEGPLDLIEVIAIGARLGVLQKKEKAEGKKKQGEIFLDRLVDTALFLYARLLEAEEENTKLKSEIDILTK